MPNKLKYCIYKNYIFILIGLTIGISIPVIYYWEIFGSLEILFPIYGSLFSFALLIQKQRHDELKTFKELFNDFNKRYDDMNEELNQIVVFGETKELTKEDIETLFDYFNLCAEEYMYFKHGFIFPEVWEAWANGILYFLGHPRIKPIWEKEEGQGSYYGMTISKLSKVTDRDSEDYFYYPNKPSG